MTAADWAPEGREEFIRCGNCSVCKERHHTPEGNWGGGSGAGWTPASPPDSCWARYTRRVAAQIWDQATRR